MSKQIGVILSGCGVYDGSEIHESVFTLLALDRAGAKAVCMAPDVDQMHVINHLKGEETAGEKRNVLIESARIARGDIKNIKDVQASDLDALILPGGYGAAKNLCDFATKGENCQVNPDVSSFIQAMQKDGKPIGFICISPAIIAKIAQEKGMTVQLTIGTDKQTASALEKMGACHVNAPVSDIVVDEEHKIITTPAYMLAERISEAADGIEKLVNKVLEMA
jgi:enhancing lycopene biosynthesis protein 2